ncbi:MAG: ATP-binding protein [Proteobacteria bacterium]|nr:ATP-binding protein [Pseudomonadota bacterium]
MSSRSTERRPETLVQPSPAKMLDAVLRLGREIHLEMDEPALVGRFLATLSSLFPERAFAVRAFDPRSPERARSYVVAGQLREGITDERITVKASSVEKTRLKSAVMKSARIRLSDRWDSPFPGIAAGFAVPLVASGEFYGVLDVGYPLGYDLSEVDAVLILPIANHLSVALRNERLHRDTTVLRDYQAKLIEHANALILGVDRHWRVTVCNQALCRLTAYERHEVVGRDVRDWLSGEEASRLTRLFNQALLGDLDKATSASKVDSVDVTLDTRNGRVRTVWSVAAISGRGQVEAVVAIGQDQTKLRELQSQVIQAEKLASLGQLAAGVVHELNNPLTSITVYAEYLLKKLQAHLESGGAVKLISGDVEKLKRISAGAQRISLFARDLVHYAKPSRDSVDTVDINSVATQALAFCEHLERSGVTLVASFHRDLPLIQAVPGQLEQVMINLITNAVHAVAGNGTVMLHTFCPEPGYIAFSVADSGPGVPFSYRARVFEPFFTTKTDGQGTGLGLSIVRNIVDQHRGRIAVGDAESGGALFTVVLPVDREPS